MCWPFESTTTMMASWASSALLASELEVCFLGLIMEWVGVGNSASRGVLVVASFGDDAMFCSLVPIGMVFSPEIWPWFGVFLPDLSLLNTYKFPCQQYEHKL